MSIMYNAVVLFVTLVFFVGYVYYIKRFNLSSGNIKAALTICIFSAVISIAMPLFYVLGIYYDKTMVIVLLGSAIVVTAIIVYLIIGYMKGDLLYMLKEFFSKAVVSLFGATNKIRKKGGRFIDSLEYRNIKDDSNKFEDMGAFKFIISNARKVSDEEVSRLTERTKTENESWEHLQDESIKPIEDVSDNMTSNLQNEDVSDNMTSNLQNEDDTDSIAEDDSTIGQLNLDEQKKTEQFDGESLQQQNCYIKLNSDTVENSEVFEHETVENYDFEQMNTVNIEDILKEMDESQKEEIELMAEEIQSEAERDNQLNIEQNKTGVSEEIEKCKIHHNNESNEQTLEYERIHTSDKYEQKVSDKKFVDSDENIDRMRIENDLIQDLQQENKLEITVGKNLTVERCIDMAFVHKAKGEFEEAVSYYMHVLEKHLSKDLVLMVLLDICALYKEMGSPETAKNILKDYLAKHSGMLNIVEKEEIEKNLQ